MAYRDKGGTHHMAQDLGQGPVAHHLHVAQDKGVGPCDIPLAQVQEDFSSTHT